VKITEEVKVSMSEQKGATDDFGEALRGMRTFHSTTRSVRSHIENLGELITAQKRSRS